MNPLVRPFALFWRYWPQLVACYLVGTLARHWGIELAAWAGHDNEWATALIMPMVAIARLGTYAAMFLVLGRAVPALADLARRSARSVDLFTSIVIPFFAVYVAWQLFRQDWIDLESRAQDYRVEAAVTSAVTTDFHAAGLPATTVTWVLVGAALLVRAVLTLLGSRLPKWLLAVRLYADALWVFLSLTFFFKAGLEMVVKPGKWLSERRVVVWLDTTRADLFSHVRPLEIAWEYLVSAIHVVFGGAAVPLMWLGVAGIVYGASASGGWRGAVHRTVGRRATEFIERTAQGKVSPRWGRVPGTWQSKLLEFFRSLSDRFEPIVDSIRIVLHGGVFALSLYVLAYLVLAWLDMSGSFYGLQTTSGYLVRGMAWVLGPHPFAYWVGFSDLLGLLSDVVIEPLRICLITSTFAYCLEHAMRSQHEPEQDARIAAGDVDGSGLGVAGQQEGELQWSRVSATAGSPVGSANAESADSLISPLTLPVDGDANAVADRRRTRPVDGDDE
ncbi:MAG: hypothetical protein QOH57_988 [Mycobacterium sp.]|nr:hypothetical protein [Mycobacterium sp.]